MDELFGAPVSSIAAMLGVAFGFAVAFLLFIRVRNPILVRMASRNVLRRPGQTMLILGGLMLDTAIIASAFTVGGSSTHGLYDPCGNYPRKVRRHRHERRADCEYDQRNLEHLDAAVYVLTRPCTSERRPTRGMATV